LDRDRWKLSGALEKQILDGRLNMNTDDGCIGIRWLERFAVLTEDSLLITKSEHEHAVTDCIPLAEVGRLWTEESRLPSSEVRNKSQLSNDELQFSLTIQTIQGSLNSGRRYVFRFLSKDECEDWLDTVELCMSRAKQRKLRDSLKSQHGQGTLSYYRARGLVIFESDLFQYSTAVIIVLAFAVDILDAQLLPEEGTEYAVLLLRAEIILAILFLLELIFHLTVKSNNCFKPFWRSPINMIDALVIVLNVLELFLRLVASGIFGGGAATSLKVVRLLRVVRVLRLFKRLHSLNMIIYAISRSLIPVAESLFILLVVTACFAILATHQYRERSPEFFHHFSVSFFTMVTEP
jgi:hypothetical protein